MHLNTQNNEFVMNALLECIKFLLHIAFLNVLLESIHLTYSQLFINSMFAFLLQELDLLQYS